MCSRKQELHSSRFLSVQKALHLEVTRKLKLAAVTEGKEGREIICSEIFADVTGELDKRAKACLKTPEHLYFYEILSLFYCNYQSEADLFVQLSCSLWGQPYVAPVFALLLHKRLLLTEEAETASDQLKHVNVLVQGARYLFWGDLHANCYHFAPMYKFLLAVIAMDADNKCLQRQPMEAREPLVSLVATFMPYYSSLEVILESMSTLPSPTSLRPGGGANKLIESVVASLKSIQSETALLSYLAFLNALKGNSIVGEIEADIDMPAWYPRKH
eukprot:jgi/Tetstr1/422578/TSEL_013386.t1